MHCVCEIPHHPEETREDLQGSRPSEQSRNNLSRSTWGRLTEIDGLERLMALELDSVMAHLTRHVSFFLALIEVDKTVWAPTARSTKSPSLTMWRSASKDMTPCLRASKNGVSLVSGPENRVGSVSRIAFARNARLE